MAQPSDQQDRPHEFYVKKSGSVDVKKGVLFERSELAQNSSSLRNQQDWPHIRSVKRNERVER